MLSHQIGGAPDEVWYAAYGTNLALDRLTCYLSGGTPPGAHRASPGARDPSPPRAVVPLELPGSVYFAWESSTWGGGIAFLDPEADATSAGRAYLLTAEQFGDIASQEMHRPPGVDLDLAELFAAGSTVVGPGRYERLVVVGELAGAPVVTITSPAWTGGVPYNRPAAAYLATMAHGLREGWGWGIEQVVGYLLGRPGIGLWDETSLRALLGRSR